jgi:hypothetical protein
MAIANFETGNSAPSVGTSKGGSKSIFMLIAAAGLVYLGYKYWYLPKKEKEKNDNQR